MTINVTEICRPNPNMLITVQSRLRLTLHKIALKKIPDKNRMEGIQRMRNTRS
jgi:hypothetical protein